MFMRNFFVVQCHPRNVFNIELFPNNGIKTLVTWSIFEALCGLMNNFNGTHFLVILSEWVQYC